ncbi:unnamed protein product [Leuciscus chuanchicus]
MLSTLNKCDTFLTISSQSSIERLRYFHSSYQSGCGSSKAQKLIREETWIHGAVEQKAFVNETPAQGKSRRCVCVRLQKSSQSDLVTFNRRKVVCGRGRHRRSPEAQTGISFSVRERADLSAQSVPDTYSRGIGFCGERAYRRLQLQPTVESRPTHTH